MSSKDFVSSFFTSFSSARLSRGKIAAMLATCIVCFGANDGNAAANRVFEYLPAPSLSPVWPAGNENASQASFNDRFEFPQAPLLQDYLDGQLYRALPSLTMASLPRRQEIIPAAEPIVGIASTYNPNSPDDKDAGNQELSSGDRYDPDGWTAAIRTDLRWQFGGVRYGRNYKPAFALVQSGDKQIIVKINDVGPLRPDRIIDLNERAMRHFDPSMQRGLLPDVKVTYLAGEHWAVGPINEDLPVTFAGSFDLEQR
jgi:rare lipoprotein A